jgi:pyridoxamine 5'-phosphate oxidase
MPPDPLAQLRAWLDDAAAAGMEEPSAAALATADAAGRPSLRFVLVRGIDERGARFFTNYDSRKARELAANPRAALTFYWQPLQRQARLEGVVERLGAEESDAYFASRARDSRIGAWASRQSRELSSREELDARVAEIEARYAGQDVPRPEFWGGFLLRPDVIEFWSGRANRLHDREEWRRADDLWKARRLSP